MIKRGYYQVIRIKISYSYSFISKFRVTYLSKL